MGSYFGKQSQQFHPWNVFPRMIKSRSICRGEWMLKMRRKKPFRLVSEDLSIGDGWCRGGTACSVVFFSSRLWSEAVAAMSGKGGAGKRGRKKKSPSSREKPGVLISPSSALHSLPPALHHFFLPSGLYMLASVGE